MCIYRRRAPLLTIAFGLLLCISINARSVNLAGPVTAAGSGAELELKSFGKYLRVGEPIEKVPFHDALKAAVLTAYQLTGQYRQVLRLCQYGEAAAQDTKQKQHERDCQRFALLNLARYREAEALALTDGRLVPADSDADLTRRLKDWVWTATLSLYQGQTSVAEKAFGFATEIAIAARNAEKVKTFDSTISPELAQSLREMRLDSIYDHQTIAIRRLADIAYYQQRHESYLSLANELLSNMKAKDGDSNSWAMTAIDQAERLAKIGKFDLAKSLVNQALPYVKADAGFRDQSEPLASFSPLPSAVIVLGDERTQPLFVQAWVRLAKAYFLIERYNESAKLLDAAEALATRYLLEPESSNTLLALVEETKADLFGLRSLWPDAVKQLRKARLRLVNATATERSSEYGRRHTTLDSPLLRVNAKFLWALTEGGTITSNGQGNSAAEIVEIASEFEASRASLSTEQASQVHQSTNVRTQALLLQEGRLVDELIDLRGLISTKMNSREPLETDLLRISALYNELQKVKADLRIVDGSNPTDASASIRFQQSLGEKTAYWQWISHVNANLIFCWTKSGIRITGLTADFQTVRARVQKLRARSSLRDVTYMHELKPFPLADAYFVYDALFKKMEDVTSSTDHWILASSSLVDGLPWGALLTIPARKQDKPSWLVEKVAITVTPSWRSWLSLSNRSRPNSTKQLLLIGDPVNEQRTIPVGSLSLKGVYIAKITGKPMVNLVADTEFGQEIADLSSLFDSSSSTVLKQKRATKSELKNLKLSDYRIIVFSTHGYLAKEFSASIGPSLELTATNGSARDRFLTASEVARLQIDADVVVLSACDTSASDGYIDSEGFSGLTSAFLLAGGRSVIASLWPVETEATKFIVTKTLSYYTKLAEPELPFALRRATLDFIRSADKKMAHPAFWSAFILVGK